MTPQETLVLARSGDLATVGADGLALLRAVQGFVAAGDGQSALELVGRTWRVWHAHGELDEGAAAAAAALATPAAQTASVWRVRTLYADGVFAFRCGDLERSSARNSEALSVATQTADLCGECDAMSGLARVALRQGRYGDVIALATEARRRAQSAGDREAEASPLHLQAAGFRLQREYLEARRLYLESLALNEELGNDSWVAMEQHNLGWVELHLGNVDGAEVRFRQRDAFGGPDAYGNAWRDLNWAAIAMARGDHNEAKCRFEAGKRALDTLRSVLDPDDESELDWLGAQLAQHGC